MANEQTTGAPLTASVGEQLAEKAHLDETREERKPGEIVEQQVERKKAEEREAALRHAGAAAADVGDRAREAAGEAGDEVRRKAEELGARARRAAAEVRRGARRAGDALTGERARRPTWQLVLGGVAAFVLLSTISRLVRR
jgi:hypothetical protein